ncbi:MAG: glycosyltransferase [Pleurocapsa sp.]
MVSSTFPYPPTKGGTHNRTFNLLQPIAQHHEVTLITQRNQDTSDQEIEELKNYVTELVIFPPPQALKARIIDKIQRLLQFWFNGTPPNVLFLYDDKIQQWIDAAVADNKFDAITCEHSVNEVYIRPEWKQKIRTIIDIHSSIYRTCRNQLDTGTSEKPWRDRFYLPLLRRYEQKSIKKFSHVVVTTDEDEQQMKVFHSHAKVTVIANGVDLDTFPYRPQDPGGHKIVFVGGLDYFVNIDAACWFATEIFPQLQQQFADATLTLVGSKPAPEVINLTQQNSAITVTGRVPSIAEYLHEATVAVAPLRTGFGMKIKTLEYMAAGIPVVGSDRGFEGIDIDDPLIALRANTVEEFAIAISNLFKDAELRDKLSRNGREVIEQKFTWLSLSRRYEKIIIGC